MFIQFLLVCWILVRNKKNKNWTGIIDIHCFFQSILVHFSHNPRTRSTTIKATTKTTTAAAAAAATTTTTTITTTTTTVSTSSVQLEFYGCDSREITLTLLSEVEFSLPGQSVIVPRRSNVSRLTLHTHTHTHTHVRTRTHTRAHAHTHTHIYIYIYTPKTYIEIFSHTHTLKHKCKHKHAYTYTHTHTHREVEREREREKYTQTNTNMQKLLPTKFSEFYTYKINLYRIKSIGICCWFCRQFIVCNILICRCMQKYIQHNKDERTQFFRKIYLSLYSKGLRKVLSVRGELETEQNCNILTPPPQLFWLQQHFFFFPFSSAAQTGAWRPSLCWDMVLIPASSLQLIWTSCCRGYIIIWRPATSCERHMCTQFNPSTVKVIPPISSTGCTCYLHWCISSFDSLAGVNMLQVNLIFADYAITI